ncbi:yemanuclein [Nasonia vitripennis]|uniref:Hpc2-related domain-containing protein n=1 Tax=Nasonia vitripennis TaxID=7425 RepID=A0A7M7G913_NASVI|nr:yemanuclein [Nasonia vitripennis]
MAEIKRIPLQSAPIQDVSKQIAKKSEKPEKKKEKQIAPSFRFVLNLHESNEQRCPEFNYSDLLKKAESRRRKEKKKDEYNASNGLSVFDENADDDKVLDVARYFEEKYGNRKKNDYVDLGAGYDENDSFIDNTDAYDELVPEDITTAFGGFYVNSGALVFKESGKFPNLPKLNHDNGNGNDDDDDDDDEEASTDDDTDENEEIATKPASKRSLSSSDETEESTQPPKSKICKELPPEINLVE